MNQVKAAVTLPAGVPLQQWWLGSCSSERWALQKQRDFCRECGGAALHLNVAGVVAAPFSAAKVAID